MTREESIRPRSSEAETACAASEGPSSASSKASSSAGSESGSESDSAWIAGEGCLIFHHSPGGAPRLCLVECLVGCDDEKAGGEEDGPGDRDGDGDEESNGVGIGRLETGAGAGASGGGKP